MSEERTEATPLPPGSQCLPDFRELIIGEITIALTAQCELDDRFLSFLLDCPCATFKGILSLDDCVRLHSYLSMNSKPCVWAKDAEGGLHRIWLAECEVFPEFDRFSEIELTGALVDHARHEEEIRCRAKCAPASADDLSEDGTVKLIWGSGKPKSGEYRIKSYDPETKEVVLEPAEKC